MRSEGGEDKKTSGRGWSLKTCRSHGTVLTDGSKYPSPLVVCSQQKWTLELLPVVKLIYFYIELIHIRHQRHHGTAAYCILYPPRSPNTKSIGSMTFCTLTLNSVRQCLTNYNFTLLILHLFSWVLAEACAIHVKFYSLVLHEQASTARLCLAVFIALQCMDSFMDLAR